MLICCLHSSNAQGFSTKMVTQHTAKILPYTSLWKAIDHIRPPKVARAVWSTSLNSQRCIFMGVCLGLYFSGLTEEEAQNCVQYETKKLKFLYMEIHKEDTCTKNKLSEKYGGNCSLGTLSSMSWGCLSFNHIVHDFCVFVYIIFSLKTPCAMRGGIN